MKFTLKKTPKRIFWADIHHVEMETEDKRRVLCVLQTKSRRRGLLAFSWRTSYSLKYYWKEEEKLIEDVEIIQALDEIFHANLIKEFNNDSKGKVYDSEEEGKIFKC